MKTITNKGNVVINAMQAEALLEIIGKYDPQFKCIFCNNHINKISEISGVKKIKDGIGLICRNSDCEHQAWNKATRLETK